MKKVFMNGTLYMLVCSLMLSSCKKEDENHFLTTVSNEAVVEDNNKGMAESDDVLSVSEADMTVSEAKTGRMSAEEEVTYPNGHGATVIITPKGTNATGNIVIDFGSTGIKSPIDNRVRKGKVLITYTGKYRVAGSMQTITLENYFVDGNKVEGTKVLTHSYEENVLITYITEKNGKITFTDNKTIEWNSERTRKWNTKDTFFDSADDELTITGTATGKSREGVLFITTIQNTHPLLWKVSCLGISNYVAVSGVMKITTANGSEYTVDYGDGNCNKEITVNVSGLSKTITLNK